MNKKKVIVDTNIVFSALLSSNSKFFKIFFEDEIEFYAPISLVSELNNKFHRLLYYSKETAPNVRKFLEMILSKINLIQLDLIPKNIYDEAYNLCKDYDQDDTPFVALALYKECSLWTGDKIKNHLSKNGFNDFFNPEKNKN